jgi:hypothetical protein
MRRNVNNNESIEKNKLNDNKKIKKVSVIIWICVCIFIYYQIVVLLQYTFGYKEKKDVFLYNFISNIISNVIPQTVNKETKQEVSVKLAAIGDIYATSNIIKSSKSGNAYDFTTPYKELSQKLLEYDVVIASLNSPISGINLGYSNKTYYNSPNEILDLIKKLNISVVSMANSHIFDKNEKGLETTLQNLEKEGINQTGVDIDKTAKPYVIEKNGINIGILSYATNLNVKPLKGKEYLVNIFSEDKLKTDIEYLNKKKVDFIVCYISEYNDESSIVDSNKKDRFEILFKNGVDVVFGVGPKVVQSKTEEMYEYESNKNKHVYAIYSLGDFLGDLDKEEKRTNVIGDIIFQKTIVKDKNGNVIEEKTKSNMKANTPIKLYNKVTSIYKITNYNIDLTLENYNNSKVNIDVKDYNLIKDASDRLKRILN